MAAKWEFEENKSVPTARWGSVCCLYLICYLYNIHTLSLLQTNCSVLFRSLLQRGLRMNPKSKMLWLEVSLCSHSSLSHLYPTSTPSSLLFFLHLLYLLFSSFAFLFSVACSSCLLLLHVSSTHLSLLSPLSPLLIQLLSVSLFLHRTLFPFTFSSFLSSSSTSC